MCVVCTCVCVCVQHFLYIYLYKVLFGIDLRRHFFKNNRIVRYIYLSLASLCVLVSFFMCLLKFRYFFLFSHLKLCITCLRHLVALFWVLRFVYKTSLQFFSSSYFDFSRWSSPLLGVGNLIVSKSRDPLSQLATIAQTRCIRWQSRYLERPERKFKCK